MRLLCLLLAGYFAVLGCLPCTDAEPCATPAPAVAMVRAAPADGHSHDGLDWCAPLCQCHCCAGFAVPLVVAALALPPRPVAGVAGRRYAARAVPGVPGRAVGAPWQPPRA